MNIKYPHPLNSCIVVAEVIRSKYTTTNASYYFKSSREISVDFDRVLMYVNINKSCQDGSS